MTEIIFCKTDLNATESGLIQSLQLDDDSAQSDFF